MHHLGSAFTDNCISGTVNKSSQRQSRPICVRPGVLRIKRPGILRVVDSPEHLVNERLAQSRHLVEARDRRLSALNRLQEQPSAFCRDIALLVLWTLALCDLLSHIVHKRGRINPRSLKRRRKEAPDLLHRVGLRGEIGLQVRGFEGVLLAPFPKESAKEPSQPSHNGPNRGADAWENQCPSQCASGRSTERPTGRGLKLVLAEVGRQPTKAIAPSGNTGQAQHGPKRTAKERRQPTPRRGPRWNRGGGVHQPGIYRLLNYLAGRSRGLQPHRKRGAFQDATTQERSEFRGIPRGIRQSDGLADRIANGGIATKRIQEGFANTTLPCRPLSRLSSNTQAIRKQLPPQLPEGFGEWIGFGIAKQVIRGRPASR